MSNERRWGRSPIGRSHGGLIGAFGNFLVKTGRVPKAVGRFLNRAREVRLTADYSGDSIEPADAREMVAEAEIFVAAMRDAFMPESPDGDDGMTP